MIKMDNKILRAYKNWGIGQVVTILRRQGYKLNEKKVREVLAKNKIKIRQSGHNWRSDRDKFFN
jgi:hypothetical protein